ncbi:serine hydrolase domain-containing protein [Latilactobacillus fuchuensis]|nr:serine hydrolase domain-containing protein [Latilactobacillus fuchuensis]
MKQKIIIAMLIAGLFILGIGATAHHYRHQLVVQANQSSQQLKQVQQQLQTTQKQLAKQVAKANHSAIDTRTTNQLTETQQQLLAQKLADSHFSGTVLLVKNNRIIYQDGRGYANYEQQKLITPQTTYQIASIQKSLTAVLVMKAVEAGQLKLTDRIGQYYPQIKEGQKITIQMMLDMQSGLIETAGPTTVLSDQQRLAYALTHIEVKNIGQHFYSPINYLLLAGVLEKVTHQSYQQLFEKQVSGPLALTSLGFMPNHIAGQQAISYTVENDFYGQAIPVPIFTYTRELGTGNMYATASSLFQVEQAIAQGHVISRNSLQQLRHTQTGGYSGGVYNWPTYFTSHGVESGYESAIQISQDGQSGVVLLSNQYKVKPVSLVGLTKTLYQQFCETQTKA